MIYFFKPVFYLCFINTVCFFTYFKTCSLPIMTLRIYAKKYYIQLCILSEKIKFETIIDQQPPLVGQTFKINLGPLGHMALLCLMALFGQQKLELPKEV